VFISVIPFWFGFYVVTSEPRFLFGSGANVFLPGKAEMAVETRHVFVVRHEDAENFQRRVLGG
jgi:hypothetical protein